MMGADQPSPGMSALLPKADLRRSGAHDRFVPIADINHHLFSAVVIALIRLVQFGESLNPTPARTQEIGWGS
jgi:hypothetical protein